MLFTGLALPDVSHGHGEGDRSVKDATNGARVKKRIDVFISYRRCSGSHLARWFALRGGYFRDKSRSDGWPTCGLDPQLLTNLC